MTLLTRFTQTCTILSVSRDRFGDWVQTGGVEEKCRFRQIGTVRREGTGEVLDSDAMLWLRPGAVVAEGSTILADGGYYEIERINRARKLGSSKVEFIKCDLKRVSIS